MADKENLRYLELLASKYPTIKSAAAEIIKLEAIMNLPKGTEHFMSDLHGEYEAFLHILNNASGVIKEKVDILYKDTLSVDERAVLATIIYYTEAKLEEIKETVTDLENWYKITLKRVLSICRLISSKYTEDKVRKALPKDFADIIDELLHTDHDDLNKDNYFENIISSIIEVGEADEFLIAVSNTIKYLAVDRLHIVGDIFDRGPRADIIMDSLINHHSVDVQWGNHDILWMGAASGSRTCIANVLNNSMSYSNLEVIETGYGINLRPLALFANEMYQNVSTECFYPKISDKDNYNPKNVLLISRMHKAIAIILFKLEGQIILRNPAFNMNDRLLLDKIDYSKKEITICNKTYKLSDTEFPTINPENPYELTKEEAELMEQLSFSFKQSEKLQRHTKFLYSKGGLYSCQNNNLLFHGCIPLNEDGSFMSFKANGQSLSGKQFLDYAETMARQGYYGKSGSKERQLGKDFLWFLWCGKNSPLFGREKMTTFERLLIKDSSSHTETKNPYYTYYNNEEHCLKILREFNLGGLYSHIINGHIPVKTKDGELPVKANGKLIVIDGGFCKAYQPTTGIAGYTLIYSSYGMRISAHEPFIGTANAIKTNKDILSTAVIFETAENRIKIADTDDGKKIKDKIENLKELLKAYQKGILKQQHN